MKKKALRKDFYMEIRKSMGRFLSIFFIVAIGCAFFAGIRSSEPDMRYSGDAYFDRKNLMDLQVISTMGLTDEDVEAIEKLDGIEKAEAGYSVDALCTEGDNQIVMHVMSLLPSMNQVQVENGRLPEKSDECVVDADFLSKSTLKIGDRVTLSSGTDKPVTDSLKEDTFTIVGSVSSPCYIGFQRGSTTIGSGNISAFLCGGKLLHGSIYGNLCTGQRSGETDCFYRSVRSVDRLCHERSRSHQRGAGEGTV